MTDVRPEWRELEGEIEETIRETFSDLRATVRKNLAALVIGLVLVLRLPRGWYGRLSLSGVARGLPTRGEVTARYKRLHRFLDNPRFSNESLSAGLLRLAVGGELSFACSCAGGSDRRGRRPGADGQLSGAGAGDSSGPGDVCTLRAGASQNLLEEDFLRRLAAALPPGVRLVLIMDRGYARAALLLVCRRQGWLFVIRGRIRSWWNIGEGTSVG